MKPHKTRDLHKAMQRRNDAARAIGEIVEREFPVDAHLSFHDHGKNVVYSAVVVMHGHGGRLKVRNLHTNTERWIYPERIHPAFTPRRSR
jgi:hypothetical protein